MASPSDLFTFDFNADDAAKQRRADITDNTAGMISGMMNNAPTFQVAESNPQPATLSTWSQNQGIIRQEDRSVPPSVRVDALGKLTNDLMKSGLKSVVGF